MVICFSIILMKGCNNKRCFFQTHLYSVQQLTTLFYWKILNICPILLWDIGMLFVLVFQVFPKPDWVSKLTECHLSETVKMLRVGQFKPKSPLLLSLLMGSFIDIHSYTPQHMALLHSSFLLRLFSLHTPLFPTLFLLFLSFSPTLISEFHRNVSVAFCHIPRNAHRSEFGRPELQNPSVSRPGSFTRLLG